MITTFVSLCTPSAGISGTDSAGAEGACLITGSFTEVIDTAKAVLHTGQIGDGKVFVYDIENVVKIRTGEEGFLALQDTDA